MSDERQARVPRRPAILRMLAAVAGVGLVGVRPAAAQVEQMTVSGGGVNVKQMPAPTGKGGLKRPTPAPSSWMKSETWISVAR